MRILVCYDGSIEGKKALDLALEFAAAFEGELVAATAIEGDPLMRREARSIERTLSSHRY